MVIWFVGLSGSGKSYFANQILRILNKKKLRLYILMEMRLENILQKI